MKKIVTALLAAATIALATMATSGTAEARWWGPGPVFGGFVAGALVGSALAAPYYYPYGYYGTRIRMARAFGGPIGTATAGYAPATKRRSSAVAISVNNGVPRWGTPRRFDLG